MNGRGKPARSLLAAAALSAALAVSCADPPPRGYASPDYGDWERTTATTLDYPVPGHLDKLRVPRINPVGRAAQPRIEDGRARWAFPAGTVIVKEIYPSAKPSPGEKPEMLTIMAKEPEDPRARGGWLWITKGLPDGRETLFEGDFCYTCHANANESHPYGDRNENQEFRDYVFFVPEASR